MTKSYNQLSPEVKSKLELLGIDIEVKYIIENQSSLTRPSEQLANLLKKPSTSTASLRAPEGYHLPNIMSSLEGGILDKFGGHPCAAGFSTRTEALSLVKQGFLDYLSHGDQGVLDMSSYQSQIPSNLIAKMTHSMRASLDKNVIYIDYNQLNLTLLAEVFRLEPFGIDFPFPYFLFELPSLRVASRKVLGSESKHIKIGLDNGINLTFFNLELDLVKRINAGNSDLIILAKLSQNTWNNKTTLELIGEAICVS